MWNKAQEQEKKWWGNCVNTLGEELKQLIYAEKMGLKFIQVDGVPFIIDLEGKRIADIGGGPESLLLKARNGEAAVFDPCEYPKWVEDRYNSAGIFYAKAKGEDLILPEGHPQADEVWIYNVLQHVEDPEKVIKNAKKIGRIIRIFEWIDAEINEMHPHRLTEEKLNEWLGGKGKVEVFNGINGCYGKAYYGTF